MPSVREQVSRLLQLGRGQTEIASILRVAPATVAYHVRQLDRRASEPTNAPEQTTAAPVGADWSTVDTRVATRQAVRRRLDAGMSRAEIARELDLSKPTVTYHARRLGFGTDARFAGRYDWKGIQAYYDQGHSIRECCAVFGCTPGSWHAAKRRGAIVTRPPQIPIEQLLITGVRRNRVNVKRRLLEAGLKEPRCEECGLDSWQGAALSLALHHVNGVRDDNRLENLRLLCPNCHSQTPNFAGRRGIQSSLSDSGPITSDDSSVPDRRAA